jgi:hypothetical protein
LIVRVVVVAVVALQLIDRVTALRRGCQIVTVGTNVHERSGLAHDGNSRRIIHGEEL